MRIGNFFVPFSLEQVTNDTNNIFLERAIPSQGVFAADRELGIAFYNATEIPLDDFIIHRQSPGLFVSSPCHRPHPGPLVAGVGRRYG